MSLYQDITSQDLLIVPTGINAVKIAFKEPLAAASYVKSLADNLSALSSQVGAIKTSTARTDYLSYIRVSAGSQNNLLSQFTLSNSNGISFGLNNQIVTASYTVPGTAGLISSINISAGTTSNNLTAFTFSDGSGVSFGLNGSVITATVQTNYLTTAMASNRGSDFVQATAAFAGTNASGTINSTGISVSVAAPVTTAGLISAVNLSAGTTSNNLSAFTFSNSNNVSFGLNGSVVTASATVASTQGSINVSAGTTSGNVSAFTFANSNGVSFGFDAGTITATVQTNYLTTAMASNQGSDFVQATAAFAGTNASGTINSTGISVSVAAPVTTAGLISAVNLSAGTTSNNLTAFTFSNSNNVSFGLDGSTVTASVTVASTQGSLRFSAGTTSVLSSAFTFSNSNNVSFGIDNGTITASVTVASSQGSVNFSAGTTSNNASAITFANSNGVSFGFDAGTITATVQTNYLTTAMASNRGSDFVQATAAFAGTNASGTINSTGISVSVNATVAQTNQTVGLYASSNTYLTSSGTVDARSLTFRGDKSITVGVSAGEVVFSVGAYLTTAMASNMGSDFVAATAGFNGTNASGTMASNSWSVSVAAQTNQTVGLYASSNTYLTSSGTVDARSLTFRGDKSITVGVSAGEVVFSVGAYITTAMASNRGSDFVAATAGFNGTNASGTMASDSWSVSVAAQTNQTLGIYASSNTTMTSSGTVDARSLSFRGIGIASVGYSNNEVLISVPAGGVGLSNINLSAGTTSQNLSAFVFSNSNNVSFGLNGSTVTASATVASSQGSVNFSAGTTSNNISAITFSNSNGYSFGLNASTVTIQGPVVGYLEPFPMTNTAIFGPVAGSWYFAPFVAPGSMSGGRINFLMQNTSTAQLFRDMTAAYVSSSTGGQQQGYTYSLAVALFSQGTGDSSTRLESNWSNSFSFAWTKLVSVSLSGVSQFNISLGHTISYISEIGSNGAYTLTTFNSQRSSSIANSSTASSWGDTVAASIRNMVSNSVIYPIGFNTTITAGNYWLAFAWSTTRSNASTGTRISTALDFSQSSVLGISRLVLESAYRNWASTATTDRSHIMPYGVYTAAANMVPPANVILSSDLSSIASAWVPYFNFQNQGITK